MTIDKQALHQAAEKFRATYAAHRQNPRNYEALDAWDKATNEFQQLVNNDELNIIALLLGELETKEEQRANWFQMAQKLGEDLDVAEKRIAELEARTVTLPDVEKWRSVDSVRAQNAYKVLVSKVLTAAGISIKGSE